MKTIKLLLLIFCIHCVNAQQKSKITDVTVYLDGAEINRTAILKLKSGNSEFTFNELSPYIEESSIQISGLKKVSILSINYDINYLSKQKQNDSIEALQQELKNLSTKKAYQYNLISGYNEEITLIQSNKRLGNETKVVSLHQLKAFASYYRERITELKTAINDANIEIENYEETESDIRRQINEFNVDEKIQTGEIKIKLNSENPTELKLKLSYNVKNAGWFPIYDLKAEKINSPINLEYKAHVFQNSGCDWSDVNLVLSTSDPNTNNEKPIVNPKYLNFVSYSNYQSQRATRSYNYKYNPLVKTVSGVVTTADDGLPLPGASVIEKGTTNGAQTDFDGRYSLKTTSGNTLQYSYVGMETEELPIHSSIMNVSLNNGPELDEVVVVGYGTTSKSYSNVSQSLAGEAAGVNIINNGQPGSTSTIRIRGFGTVNGNKPPLYVVDGVPYAGNLQDIDPKDIESTTILKDTDATAIYGSRGANGAVLLTLKGETKRKINNLGIVVETGITNTRFEIDKTYTIPSDGDVTVIEIDKFDVPANYEYFAAPVLNENVFLTAKIGNWEQYNLLPAEANVYFEGSYSGKTNINPGATTDSLTISLGVDPNIIVKRTQRNNFKKTTFIGNNKMVYKAYDIVVRNNKQSNISLTLLDRIPITQNKSIKLDDIETGSSVYDKDKGILKWIINLKPGETEKVQHSYSIKHPKGKHVNI